MDQGDGLQIRYSRVRIPPRPVRIGPPGGAGGDLTRRLPAAYPSSRTSNRTRCFRGGGRQGRVIRPHTVEQGQLNWIANFLWGIADDVLRDLYVRSKYRDLILPMTAPGRCIGRFAERADPTRRCAVSLCAR